MTYGILRGTLMFAAIQLAVVSGAQANTDSLRCAARTLRCQSHFYQCLAACDYRLDAQSYKTADILQTRLSRCEAVCDERNSRRLATIKRKPPCRVISVTPNRRECEARYLGVEASYMVCQSRCANQADPAPCQATCTTRYETDLDQLKVEPVCAQGRVNQTSAPGSF